MNYLLYNDKFFVEIPEWAKSYKYTSIHIPNLGDTYLLAYNQYTISKSDNLTYGVWHDTHAVNPMKSIYLGSSSGWDTPTQLTSNEWICGQSPYMDGSYRAFWSNKDITCLDDDYVEYVIMEGTEPIDPTPPDVVYPQVPFVLDKKSFMLGNWAKRMISSIVDPRFPKSYSYNGTKLARFPLYYDKHKYPYCMILQIYPTIGNTYYYFYAFSSIEYRTSSSGFWHTYGIRCYDFLSLYYNGTSKKWDESFTRHLDTEGGMVALYSDNPSSYSYSVLWSNFTVTNKDGSLTEPYVPTPVY